MPRTYTKRCLFCNKRMSPEAIKGIREVVITSALANQMKGDHQ